MADEVVQLRGGFTTKDKRLNRLPEKDEASREFPVTRLLRTMGAPRVPKSKMWSLNLWLDQGEEGACTGFSRAHNMASTPRALKGVTEALAHQIYQRAKVLDDYSGEDYEGSSVIGAVKAAVEMEYVVEYHWGFTLEEFLLGMTYAGPATIGCNWYPDMRDPDMRGYIHPTGGPPDGGHAILILGQQLIPGVGTPYDLDQSYVIWHNSWGKTWGLQGRAKMTLREFDKLRLEDSEVCFSTDRLK